jgi:ubiquinone biosynthesis protein
MSEQLGWRGLLRHVREEAPAWGVLFPQLPRLMHRALTEGGSAGVAAGRRELADRVRRQTRWLAVATVLLVLSLLLQLYALLSSGR